MAGSVRAGDIISLSGRVVSKREVDGLGLVECAVVVAAQEGDVGQERVVLEGKAESLWGGGWDPGLGIGFGKEFRPLATLGVTEGARGEAG